MNHSKPNAGPCNAVELDVLHSKHYGDRQLYMYNYQEEDSHDADAFEKHHTDCMQQMEQVNLYSESGYNGEQV